MGEIHAQHIASFLEHDGPLNQKAIMHNLDTVFGLETSSILDCSLRIVDEAYLTVHIDNETDPSECFDLTQIDDIRGYSCDETYEPYRYLLVFRFLASQLTDGESPNELHIFSMDSEEDTKATVDWLDEAARIAKQSSRKRKSNKPVRSMSKRKNTIAKPHKIQRVPRDSNATGTREMLEDLNVLLDEIEQFEANLHDAVSYQVTGSTKIDRSLWHNSLSPPSYEAAVENVERIRTCINYTSLLREYIVDPGPGDLLNRLFESLWWLQKICDCNRVLHYDSNLIRKVWRPPFSDKTVDVLHEYLQSGNRSFLNTLGDAWIVPSGKPNSETDFEFSRRASRSERSRAFKPEMTIKDYGYYKPTPTLSMAPSTKDDNNMDMESFINGVRARGGTLVVAKQRHISEGVRELSVNVGDILEVLDDSGEWCCVRSPAGATGHIPRKIIEVLEDHSEDIRRSRASVLHRSKSPRGRSDSRKTEKKTKSKSHSNIQGVNSEAPSDDYINSYFQNGQPQTQQQQIQPAQVQQVVPQHAVQAQPLNSNIQYATPVTVNSKRGTAPPIVHQGQNGQPTVIIVPTPGQQGQTQHQIQQTKQNQTPYLIQAPIPPQPVIVPVQVPSSVPLSMMQPPMFPNMMAPGPPVPQMYPPNNYGLNPYQMNFVRGDYDDYGYNTLRERRYRSTYDNDYYEPRSRRWSSNSPKRSSKKTPKSKKKGKARRSSISSSSSSSRSSSSSSSGSSDAKQKSYNKKAGKSHSSKTRSSKIRSSKMNSQTSSPPPPPPPPAPVMQKDDNDYDAIDQNVRKKRLLNQMNVHRPPPHIETMNKELQARMLAMRQGQSNGLKPTNRRKLDDSQFSSIDPASDIARLATQMESAQVA